MGVSERSSIRQNLAVFGDEEGNLPRQTWASAGWYVFETVRLEDEHLIYEPGQGWRSVGAGSGLGLLEKFAALAEAPDVSILAYARRWGVLEICEHGVPATHRRPEGTLWPGVRGGALNPIGCRPELVGGDASNPMSAVYREPVAAWRLFAGQAFSALAVAAALIESGAPALKDLHRLRPLQMPPLTEARARTWTADEARTRLAEVVDSWVVLGDVRPECVSVSREDRQGNPQTVLGAVFTGSTLFGALAVQLFGAVTGTSGPALCSGCGLIYFPEEKPALGKRRYCVPCKGKAVPVRDAERDRAARLRSKIDRNLTAKPTDDCVTPKTGQHES